MDLFAQGAGGGTRGASAPLAARMRPRTLDDIVGQDAILGAGRLLRRAIEADRLQSIVLYGPPGCGKTSLAEVIAGATERYFERSSGVTSNVAALREVIARARHRQQHVGQETILFIDEIHRFNKAQQDVLLPHVEDGAVTLIGATTHNPLVFINTPLTSRSLIFELSALSANVIAALLHRAVTDERGLAHLDIALDDDAVVHVANVCEGDARRALNALEIAALTTAPNVEGRIDLTRAVMEDSMQKKAVVYDHDEDGHYDTISAFIKSVRGSDPDAAVYWLAKMLYAGEDPRFIARRLVILASEDIGNADPRGLLMATAAMQSVEFVGMPEARIILAHATTYLASAPKSNASYKAIEAATEAIKAGRTLSVPEHLKNLRVTRAEGGADDTGPYVYPHDYKGHHIAQQYVPTADRFYEPSDQGYEETIKNRLARWAAARRAPSTAETAAGRRHG